MRKDRSRGEGLFQGIKCYPTVVIKVPQSVLSSEMSEQCYTAREFSAEM